MLNKNSYLNDRIAILKDEQRRKNRLFFDIFEEIDNIQPIVILVFIGWG